MFVQTSYILQIDESSIIVSLEWLYLSGNFSFPSILGKLAKPRQLHNSQWGMMCPAETPEGQVSFGTHYIVLSYKLIWEAYSFNI